MGDAELKPVHDGKLYSQHSPLEPNPLVFSSFVLVFSATILASCSTAKIQCGPTSARVNGHLNSPFIIASKVPWNETGIFLEKGKSYRITASPIGKEAYADDTIPATPSGVTGKKGERFDQLARDASGPGFRAWFVRNFAEHILHEGKIHHLRVLTDAEGKRATFLTLIAAIGKDDSQKNVHVIGTGSTITARRSGELVLFSNDWPGGSGTEGDARFCCSRTYANNKGSLSVTVKQASGG